MRALTLPVFAALLLFAAPSRATEDVQLVTGAAGLKARLEATATDPRPVVVHFWATWCAACRAELPALRIVFAEAGKRGARVVLVSLDSPTERTTEVPAVLDVEKVPGERWLLDSPEADPVLTLVGAGWDGTLPATFVYRGGARTAAFIGRLGKPAKLYAALATRGASPKAR